MDTALDALFSKTMQAVLELLLLHPQREYYQREIAEETGMHLQAVQQALQRLVGAGIISRSERGRQVFYRPADDCPILEELTSIIVKTVGVRERMRKALAPLEEKIHCAAIFGSWARGDQQPDSDIDLLIIGSVSLREVSKALRGPAAELGREVSPVVMSHRELRDRLDEGDHFATRLAESEMIRIIGDTDDFGDLAR